jgi:hypothetical protein
MAVGVGNQGRNTRLWALAAVIFVLLLAGCQTATTAGGPGTGVATAVAQAPTGVGVTSMGEVHVVDTSNSIVREINKMTDAESVIAGTGGSGFTGDGGLATAADLDLPTAMTIDGRLFRTVEITGFASCRTPRERGSGYQ